MKILITMTIFATLFRFMVLDPSAPLPQYPVKGTLKVERSQLDLLPGDIDRLSKKLYYLKTGRNINTERNYAKQQNYWGAGVPTNVRFPVHLVKWEEFRRKRDAQKKVLSSN